MLLFDSLVIQKLLILLEGVEFLFHGKLFDLADLSLHDLGFSIGMFLPQHSGCHLVIFVQKLLLLIVLIFLRLVFLHYLLLFVFCQILFV